MTDTEAEQRAVNAKTPWGNGYTAGKASQQGELQWHREEVQRLRADNAAMLAALKEITLQTSGHSCRLIASAAISRAEGRT